MCFPLRLCGYLSSLSKTLNTFHGVLNSSVDTWRQIAKGASAFRWLRAVVESWSAGAIPRNSVKHGYLFLQTFSRFQNTYFCISISHVAGTGRTLQATIQKTDFVSSRWIDSKAPFCIAIYYQKRPNHFVKFLMKVSGPPEVYARDIQAEPP